MVKTEYDDGHVVKLLFLAKIYCSLLLPLSNIESTQVYKVCEEKTQHPASAQVRPSPLAEL